MKATSIATVGALVCFCASTLAQAAPKNNPQPKAPPGETVRYFALPELLGELSGEVTLKERRQGPRVLSAELEVCHSLSAASPRRDRYVVPLKVEGNRLVGSAQTQEEKVAVVVNLTRRGAGGKFNFEGTITRGGQQSKVSSKENTDMSEAEFAETQPADDAIDETPKDFTEVSPQSLQIRVARASLAPLVNSLRAQNVKVSLGSLEQDCKVLRVGSHVVSLGIDPDRAGALLATLKGMPGVSAVGYGPGSTNMERAVRFEAAGWRDAGGKLDRDKWVEAVGAAAANAYGAQSRSSTWDDTIGELSLKLKRPAQIAPELGLTEIVKLAVLVGPEAPKSNTRLVLWVQGLEGEVVDEGSGPRLSITGIAAGEDDPEPHGSEGLIEALAKELRGEVWDSEKMQWKRP